MDVEKSVNLLYRETFWLYVGPKGVVYNGDAGDMFPLVFEMLDHVPIPPPKKLTSANLPN